jgi:N,N-dimethylformamidase
MTDVNDSSAEPELIGYASQVSVEARDVVQFMVSTTADAYDATIVRLIHGDENPAGPGFKEVVVADDVARRRRGRIQATYPGSYLVVDAIEPFELRSFTLQAWIAPTRLASAAGGQAIMGRWDAAERSGFGLFVDADGVLALWLGAGGTVVAVRGEHPLRSHEWSFVAATFDDRTGRAAVEHAALSPWDAIGVVRVEVAATPPVVAVGTRFRIGASGCGAGDPRVIAHAFDGKIDSPSVFNRALSPAELECLRHDVPPSAVDASSLVAAWDFSANQASLVVADAGARALHARCVNLPTRAVTGRGWSGREVDFRHVPDEYTAIHFHADDLEDARWDVDFEWSVPEGLRSGVYAARLEAGGLVDHIPFVVRPSAQAPRAPVLVLLPTLTYLAYANERVGDGYQTCIPPGWTLQYDPLDGFVARHPELGKSLYDVHDDQSGVCYSSALRPIANLRPRYRHRNVNAARHLAGDLYLIDWLEEKGFEYDVIADGDLHTERRQLLDHYRTLVTGSHPEYWTTAMLEAVESWVHDGGRMMYLGGNGLYWVTSVHPELPHVIEVRRGRAGSRPWESPAGEAHHSTTGELGGIWRLRGRLPNRLTGVAYAAEGAGPAHGYTRSEASYGEQGAWVFDGVASDDEIGSFGLVMDGAAGDEVDRADRELGTPAEATVLATSGALPYYGVALEDSRVFRGGHALGEARADMVLLEAPNGGAVFSAGSISWCGALSHNDYDNNVSRITHNVLTRFATAPVTSRSQVGDERR